MLEDFIQTQEFFIDLYLDIPKLEGRSLNN